MIGTTISHYRIVAKLGEGGMGEVYRAEDSRLGRAVALKLMTLPDHHSFAAETWERLVREAAEEKAPLEPTGRVRSEDARMRFLREARTVSALNHPGIVTIYDVGEWEGRLFIAMELVEGETLRKKLERLGLDTKTVIKMAISLADALGRAHRAGVTHRDVKPENIIISTEGQTKLLDFGIAKLKHPSPSKGGDGSETQSNSLTTPGFLLGTIHYMSPEQTRQEDVDPRSDLFSLGSVLYECLAGRKAFDGPTVDAMFHIAHDPPVPIRQFDSHVPEDLERIVEKLMEKDREERYQNTSDLMVDLKRAERRLSGQTHPALAAPTPLVPAVSLRAVSFRWMAGLLALAAVTGAAATFLLLPRNGNKETQVYPVTHLRRSISHPALSPDGKLLTFVSGDNQVYVALAASGEATQLTRTSGAKAFPHFSPDGSRILFTVIDSGELWQVSAIGGEPQRLLSQALYGVLSPDGSQLAFSRVESKGKGKLTLYVSGARGENPRRITDVDATPNVFCAWAPDGRTLVYMEAYQKRLPPRLLVAAADGSSPPRTLLSEDLISLPPAVSPDGKWIYYSAVKSGITNLWRIHLSGGRPEQMSFSTGEDRSPVLDPSGWLYYVNARHRTRLHLISDSGDKLLTDDRLLAEAHFSPDGKRIAFVRPMWSGTVLGELVVLNIDDGHVQHVDTAGPVADMLWSPDGKRLGYSSRAGAQFEAHTVEVESGKSTALPTSPDQGTWFRGFSPSGAILLERLRRDETYGETVVYDPGSGQQRVAAREGTAFGWSNDGQWIGLYAATDLGGRILIAPATSGELKVLQEGSVFSPWFPRDRDEILFVARQSPPQFGSILLNGGKSTSAKPYISQALMNAVTEYGPSALADIDVAHEAVLVRVNESDMDIVKRKVQP